MKNNKFCRICNYQKWLHKSPSFKDICCGKYVPRDNLEYLEYLLKRKENASR